MSIIEYETFIAFLAFVFGGLYSGFNKRDKQRTEIVVMINVSVFVFAFGRVSYTPVLRLTE
jgi:hypothetical protein